MNTGILLLLLSGLLLSLPVRGEEPEQPLSELICVDGYEQPSSGTVSGEEDEWLPGTVLTEEVTDPSVYFTISSIEEGDPVYERIYGKTFPDQNDIALSDLRYLQLLHYNYDHEVQLGEMIVNAAIAQEISDIFRQLFDSEYEIYSMYLADEFWTGDALSTDTASMAADNTSCFSYRPITTSGNLSRHALGMAIDLNPLENPYVKGTDSGWVIDPPEGEAYTDRSLDNAHYIDQNDLAYELFTEAGYTWGGNWRTLKDYQHFEK